MNDHRTYKGRASAVDNMVAHSTENQIAKRQVQATLALVEAMEFIGARLDEISDQLRTGR